MFKSVCWFCEKEYEREIEFCDINCPHCGCQISIYNPVDALPDTNEGEEEMGALKDRAREKSPFITLAIGEETPVLVYKSWKETQDHWGNDTFRYMFELATEKGAVTKQLDNRSQQFAEAMDAIPFGAEVIIGREPKRDEEGNVIEDKSIWTVRKAE